MQAQCTSRRLERETIGTCAYGQRNNQLILSYEHELQTEMGVMCEHEANRAVNK
jgi:hypothetical protein